MPTPEQSLMHLSLQKYHFISLNTPTQLRFIDVVRQQIAEVDVGLLIIAFTMVNITMTKTI